MFNFNKFKTEKIAVNVETQEEYDEFMQMCEDVGIRWNDQCAATKLNHFNVYKNETCVLCDIVNKVLVYSYCDYHEKGSYQIIKFKQIKENKPMTKADLKTGMIATTREGLEYVVILNCIHQYDNITDLLVNEPLKYWSNLDSYDENLLYKDPCAERACDIVKIELASHPYSFINLDCKREKREVLWKRKEPKEMTIAEMEKELGYSVKVVKERN